jgi:3-hydroxybutyryl-CoA dehydrogenase
MTVAVLADDTLKQALLAKRTANEVNFVWADSVRALGIIEADLYIDLLFEPDAERTAHLKKLLQPVLVNAVAYTTKEIGANCIRINGWPGLLQRSVTEIALPSGIQEPVVKELFEQLQWQYQLVPDITGMITPRIIGMIINEAYYTLGARVSTREEIDIAMKLGTSYPYGPFEWSRQIGLLRIYELLQQLSVTDKRYSVAPELEKEAIGQ